MPLLVLIYHMVAQSIWWVDLPTLVLTFYCTKCSFKSMFQYKTIFVSFIVMEWNYNEVVDCARHSLDKVLIFLHNNNYIPFILGSGITLDSRRYSQWRNNYIISTQVMTLKILDYDTLFGELPFFLNWNKNTYSVYIEPTNAYFLQNACIWSICFNLFINFIL